ncbi:hypothetical protein CDAR_318961 [Caerostris darwini]|uniref:Uncharacterized protein n=1 Tax=Caerostris darwini TaxID=1538125 RepID=A0AAV4TXC5_9ARAC|nr:hypothetical protein CDAR_318961 [Caerostris darwini]
MSQSASTSLDIHRGSSSGRSDGRPLNKNCQAALINRNGWPTLGVGFANADRLAKSNRLVVSYPNPDSDKSSEMFYIGETKSSQVFSFNESPSAI